MKRRTKKIPKGGLEVCVNSDGWADIRPKGYSPIAFTVDVEYAQLFAAAPELAEALRVLIERCAYYAPTMEREGDLDDARAALKKAGLLP